MSFLLLIPLVISTFATESNQQFIPFVRRIANNQFETLGTVFSELLDDYDIGQQAYKRPPIRHQSQESRRSFDNDLDQVANEASDLLGNVLSIVAGREERKKSGGLAHIFRLPSTTVPPRGALTLGEHVCVRENKVNVAKNKTQSSCKEFDTATRCTSGGGNFTLVRTVECCQGYNTSNIREGCQPVDDLMTIAKLASRIDNCFYKIKNKINLKQTTVLINPSHECPTKELKENELDGNIIDGIFHTYDLLDSQKIPLRNGDYIIVQEGTNESMMPLLNCVEIEEGDIPASDGILHKLKRPLITSSENILDIISNRTEFSTFMQLLDNETKELLSSDSVSTIFAFTDETFATLSHSLQMRMKNHSQCTKDIIKEHAYGSTQCSARMQGTLRALSGNVHKISKEVANGTLFRRIGNARILDTDTIASNGIIHTVDDVILPDEFADWRDHLAVYEEEFLQLAEEVISGDEEPAAIFVPPKESLKNLTDDISFMENHVVPRADMITNDMITTSHGSKIPSSFDAKTMSFGCVKTSKPPQTLCKTTVYFLDQPLPIVRNNLMAVLHDREDVSVFYSLLENSTISQLIDLESEGPYTILVPSNDALSRNQVKALKRNSTLAENFIRRHIFKGFACSSQLFSKDDQLRDLAAVEKLLQGSLSGSPESGSIATDDNTVQDKDLIATNGVIHVMDSALRLSRRPSLFSSVLSALDL